MAPPQRLVVSGLYRYVRNPMYLGFLAGWVGLWVIFGRASVAAIAWACIVALFVALYEQPTLRRKFGPDYELPSLLEHRVGIRCGCRDRLNHIPVLDNLAILYPEEIDHRVSAITGAADPAAMKNYHVSV
jgi:Phospholipid methyltransferase